MSNTPLVATGRISRHIQLIYTAVTDRLWVGGGFLIAAMFNMGTDSRVSVESE